MSVGLKWFLNFWNKPRASGFRFALWSRHHMFVLDPCTHLLNWTIVVSLTGHQPSRGMADDVLSGSCLWLREIIGEPVVSSVKNALSPSSPPTKPTAISCSADWQFEVKLLLLVWAVKLSAKSNSSDLKQRKENFSLAEWEGGAGGRRDDYVFTVVLHLGFDRTLSIHWRLEERWWPWWHHSAVRCGLLESDCVFRDDDYWAEI